MNVNFRIVVYNFFYERGNIRWKCRNYPFLSYKNSSFSSEGITEVLVRKLRILPIVTGPSIAYEDKFYDHPIFLLYALLKTETFCLHINSLETLKNSLVV